MAPPTLPHPNTQIPPHSQIYPPSVDPSVNPTKDSATLLPARIPMGGGEWEAPIFPAPRPSMRPALEAGGKGGAWDGGGGGCARNTATALSYNVHSGKSRFGLNQRLRRNLIIMFHARRRATPHLVPRWRGRFAATPRDLPRYHGGKCLLNAVPNGADCFGHWHIKPLAAHTARP